MVHKAETRVSLIACMLQFPSSNSTFSLLFSSQPQSFPSVFFVAGLSAVLVMLSWSVSGSHNMSKPSPSLLLNYCSDVPLTCLLVECPTSHLYPRLHAAANFAIFRVLAKNRKNRKVDDFSRSPAIFRSSLSCFLMI